MKIACVLLVLVGSATAAFAQISVSDFDGLTPVGLQPGSPAGSYALSGMDSVNLYNGSANITIPLLNIGGRGEAGYTMAANYGARWNGAGILSTDAPCSPTSPCPLWTFQTSGWANWLLHGLFQWLPAVRCLYRGTHPNYRGSGGRH